jgi:hypothetical protein
LLMNMPESVRFVTEDVDVLMAVQLVPVAPADGCRHATPLPLPICGPVLSANAT